MKIEGGCHCGYITYEAEVDPDKVSICHCTDCQTLSGSAFRTAVPAPREAFRLRTGQPKIYVKTAESGTKRPKHSVPNAARRFMHQQSATRRRSLSVSARFANEPSCVQKHRSGADPRSTGLWICPP
jgi:hypothetical protein